MAVVVRFDNKEWERFTKKLDINIRNPQPFLKAAFSTIGFRDIIQHFQQEKGQKKSWKKSERAKREGGRTLQDTGNLRGNFSPTNLENQGRDAIIFFNPTPYAAIHDEGSKKGNIPKRDFMYLSDKAEKRMLKSIMDRLVP